MSEEKFTGMKPGSEGLDHLRRMSSILKEQRREKEHMDSQLRAHLSRGRVLLNRCTEKIKWSLCQSITAPGKIRPKHTSFAKGLCECMKGKSEVTTCRVRTLWLPSLKLKTTLKTDSGKGIKRIHFWPALHSALFSEQITSSLSLYLSRRWKMEWGSSG